MSQYSARIRQAGQDRPKAHLSDCRGVKDCSPQRHRALRSIEFSGDAALACRVALLIQAYRVRGGGSARTSCGKKGRK